MEKVSHSSSPKCYTNLLDPLAEELSHACVSSCRHVGPTNGSSLFLSLFFSPHAVLSLMDRWHPIVYWAKVQCLIGHSSGNWASVSAWPSSNLPPKKKKERKKWRGGRAGRKRKGGRKGRRVVSQSRFKKKQKKKLPVQYDFWPSLYTSLTLGSVCVSVCVCIMMVKPNLPPATPLLTTQ